MKPKRFSGRRKDRKGTRPLRGACLVNQPGDLGWLQATRQTDPAALQAALEAALGHSAGTGSKCRWNQH